MPNKNKIREEFYEEKCHYEDDDRHEIYENNPEDIADYWLKVLDQEIEKARKEERERILKLILDNVDIETRQDLESYKFIQALTLPDNEKEI